MNGKRLKLHPERGKNVQIKASQYKKKKKKILKIEYIFYLARIILHII